MPRKRQTKKGTPTPKRATTAQQQKQRTKTAKPPPKTITKVTREAIGAAGFLALDEDSDAITQAALNHVNLTRGSVEYKIRTVKLSVYRYGQDGVVTGEIGPAVLDAAGLQSHVKARSAGGDLTMTVPSTTGWAATKHAYIHIAAPPGSVVQVTTILEVRDVPVPQL
jgi:hypothetical protein